MSESKHTPLPWLSEVAGVSSLGPDGVDVYQITIPGGYRLVAEQMTKANAAMIVRAVNSHADLVAALEIIANDDGYAGVRTAEFKAIARAALAKVKGE